MKLGVVHVNAEKYSGLYAKLITSNFERSKAKDTQLTHRYVRHLRRATDTVFPYPILLNKVDVVEEALAAYSKGVDAILVACSGDPGVAEARTLMPIPVVGPMEAALHLACGYGYKIGIVTVRDRSWVEYCEMIAQNCGLSSRLVGIQSIQSTSDIAFTEGFSDPKRIATEVASSARKLVDAGANSIVIGSAGLSVMSTSAGLSFEPETGAPIFDCLTVGLKTAELRWSLQQTLGVPSCSRMGWGHPMTSGDTGRIRKLFGFTEIALPASTGAAGRS
jgi:allantoin racemase